MTAPPLRSSAPSLRAARLALLCAALAGLGLLAGCSGDKDKDKDRAKQSGDRQARKGWDRSKADIGKKGDPRDVDVPDPEKSSPPRDAPKDAPRPDHGDRSRDRDKGERGGDKDRAMPREEKVDKGDKKEGGPSRTRSEPRNGKDTGGKDNSKPKDRPRLPEVWHRDTTRKTFARVYLGDGNSLKLVSLQVSVVIEGARARTLVDHVFHNPHDRRLEGTFEYVLPPGASPSYYAMFLGDARTPPPRFKPRPPTPGKTMLPPEALPPAELARAIDVADWGKLQEGKVVAAERAREVYEEVVRGRVDPALAEYASGNTFRGRVFPIQPKAYNRVLLAYEETLPIVAGKLLYRFDLPGCPLNEMRFSLQFDPRQAKEPLFQPKEARKEAGEERTVFSHTWSDTTPRGTVLFSAVPVDASVQACSGRHGDRGPCYLYARLRPSLPRVEKEEPFASHAVFLLDTSQSEQPDRFAVSMQLLQAILEADTSIKQFNILAFNAAAAWVEPKGWLPNTKAGREQALARLDGVLLEGATDLSAALEKLIALDFALPRGAGLSCFLLSDGHLTWGQTEVAPLVARFRKRCTIPTRFFCYRTGLGEENGELFDALSRDGGAVFQCFGKAEVAAAAGAHLRQCLGVEKVRFEGEPALREMLVAGRRSAVYPGGELIVTGHCARPGKGKLVLEGTFQGKKYSQSFPVEIRADGELAPRGWGEVAVASLLALNDPWLEGLVTAYCQEFNIASRSASFLVLENEAEYKRFHLDEARKETIKGDLDRYLDNTWSSLGKESSTRQLFSKLLAQVNKRTGVLAGQGGEAVRQLLELLEEEDCALPTATVEGAILKEKDVPEAYLTARKRDRRSVHPYLQESQRRFSDNDVAGAIRVLSSIIEEHPARGDALRLVGYRLLDLRQPAVAAQLFARVLWQRPFEPHSYRDLARSLEDARRYPLAALLNETVLAGTWDNRFREALKAVTREDQVRLLRAGLRAGKLNSQQRVFFEKRLRALAGSEVEADLRVSMSWNTDATDVDLHVIEPDGVRVSYQNKKSPSGGELSEDLTQGYGPERYHIRKARRGEYKVLVHYFRANPNLLGGETHVNVVVTRHAGTDREKVERYTVILKREGEMLTVARLRF